MRMCRTSHLHIGHRPCGIEGSNTLNNITVHFRNGSPFIIRIISQSPFRKAAAADDDFVVRHILNVAENGVESGVGHGYESVVQCRNVGGLSFKRLQCPTGESEAAAVFHPREFHGIPFRDISSISRPCPTLVSVHTEGHFVNLRLRLLHGGHCAVARFHLIGGESADIVGIIAQFGNTVGEGRSRLNRGSQNDLRTSDTIYNR